ncbi:MAG: RNA polymerase sigma factor [Lewinellaceae bacterium]|nr:RNA polymerase sigma factor [Lewinellaceae bacterium]
MGSHPDQKYVEALCRGDNRLIEEIYRKHAPEVRQWVCNNNGSPADAQDVFQRGLMAILIQYCRPDFRLTRPFGALLFAICQNLHRKGLRRNKQEEHLRNEVEMEYKDAEGGKSLLEEAEEAAEKSALQACLEKTFAQLTPLCQQALRLNAESLSGEAIAEQLGMSNRNAVYARLHDCRNRWSQLFHQQCQR